MAGAGRVGIAIGFGVSGVSCRQLDSPRGTVVPTVWWVMLNASQIASMIGRERRLNIHPTLKIVFTPPDGRDVRPTRDDSQRDAI